MLHNPCLCTNSRLQSQQSEESHGELFGRKLESKVIKIQSALTKCNTPRDFVSCYWPFWKYCCNKQSYVFIFALHFWVILGVKTCEVFLCFLVIFFLGSIVLTSHWLLCINCFPLLVRFTGFYTEYEPHFYWPLGLSDFHCHSTAEYLRSVRYRNQRNHMCTSWNFRSEMAA